MLTVRHLALVAALAAVYTVYGGISSTFLRTATRSLDLFFLIAVLFAIVATIVGRPGAATLLTVVSGIIFVILFLFVNVPFPPHILASLIANGIVFDGYLFFMKRNDSFPRVHITAAAALGNFVMAIVGLEVLQLSGLSLPAAVWVVALVGDTIVGAGGALFGLSVAKRVQHPAVTIRS